MRTGAPGRRSITLRIGLSGFPKLVISSNIAAGVFAKGSVVTVEFQAGMFRECSQGLFSGCCRQPHRFLHLVWNVRTRKPRRPPTMCCTGPGLASSWSSTTLTAVGEVRELGCVSTVAQATRGEAARAGAGPSFPRTGKNATDSGETGSACAAGPPAGPPSPDLNNVTTPPLASHLRQSGQRSPRMRCRSQLARSVPLVRFYPIFFGPLCAQHFECGFGRSGYL